MHARCLPFRSLRRRRRPARRTYQYMFFFPSMQALVLLGLLALEAVSAARLFNSNNKHLKRAVGRRKRGNDGRLVSTAGPRPGGARLSWLCACCLHARE